VLAEINPVEFIISYDSLVIRIYKTVILPVVLSGCENWSLTLKEDGIGRTCSTHGGEEERM
jgi:hypothetical protein